jgi:hypothetical protein
MWAAERFSTLAKIVAYAALIGFFAGFFLGAHAVQGGLGVSACNPIAAPAAPAHVRPKGTPI